MEAERSETKGGVSWSEGAVLAAVGVLAGMLLMLMLVWLAYYARIFVFSHCPRQAPTCTGAQVYADPGDALANGAALGDVLFLRDGELAYLRPARASGCVPPAQPVRLLYPQYCAFAGPGGTTVVGKAVHFNSPYYEAAGAVVETAGNCVPLAGYASGTPLLSWETNPVAD